MSISAHNGMLGGHVGALKDRSSDVVFGMKLSLYAILIGAFSYLDLFGGTAVRVVGVVGLGLMFAHGVELQHQVLHHLGFRNRKLNDCVGVLLGLPMLVSYAGYQASHLRHHRQIGTPDNKEFFDYGDQYGYARPRWWRSAWLWFHRFLMIGHYAQFLRTLATVMLGRNVPRETSRVSRRICGDYLAMLAFMTLLAAASWEMGDLLVVWLWVAPLCLVAAPVHAMIEMPEHYRCDTSNTDVFANTRTIRSNALMAWFTNCNNFHVEHHLMPGLPMERLPDLHEAIAPKLRHFHPTYVEFFKAVTTRSQSSAVRTDN